MRTANAQQLIRINREHRVRSAVCREGLIELQQVNIEQYCAGICLLNGRHSADRETSLLAHERGVSFGEFVAQNCSHLFLINAVRPAGYDENRRAGDGASENNTFGDLPQVAAQKQGGVRCVATRVFVLDNDGITAKGASASCTFCADDDSADITQW